MSINYFQHLRPNNNKIVSTRTKSRGAWQASEWTCAWVPPRHLGRARGGGGYRLRHVASVAEFYWPITPKPTWRGAPHHVGLFMVGTTLTFGSRLYSFSYSDPHLVSFVYLLTKISPCPSTSIFFFKYS